uniref:Bromo domain-containing protein n=2 Tax=Clastoptera arizonana TaxID=38151 RepID=A0A1B6CTW9_9HEMI
MHHKDAWPFLRPVTRSEVPDYHNIIKRPMDFGTVKHKLNMLEYRNNSEVIADARLVFDNCFIYNQADTEIYQCGLRLQKAFEKLCKERSLSVSDDDIKYPESKRSRTVF